MNNLLWPFPHKKASNKESNIFNMGTEFIFNMSKKKKVLYQDLINQVRYNIFVIDGILTL